jgi:hypothetical protein
MSRRPHGSAGMPIIRTTAIPPKVPGPQCHPGHPAQWHGRHLACRRLSQRLPSPATLPGHQETYGWVDVRDGSIGPNYRPPFAIPAGTLYSTYAAYRRHASTQAMGTAGHGPTGRPWAASRSAPCTSCNGPRYATQLTAVYNPIDTVTYRCDFRLSLHPVPRSDARGRQWLAAIIDIRHHLDRAV